MAEADVQYEFFMEEKENMKKRRINLFVLMVTSFISVVVMFFIDGYMHIFFVEFT